MLLLGQAIGLRVLVAADAVSYVVALAVSLPCRCRSLRHVRSGAADAGPRYRDALRDGANVLLAAVTLARRWSSTAPLIVLPGW